MSTDTAARPAPPALEYPFPPCSVCGESTNHDGDDLYCDSCGIYWPDEGGPGVWTSDGDGVPGIQCTSTIAPYLYSPTAPEGIRDFRFRCALDHNHVDSPAPVRDTYGLMGPDRRIHCSTDHSGNSWHDDERATVTAHNGPEAREALDAARDAELDRLDQERRERHARMRAEYEAKRHTVDTVPTGGVL